MAFRVKEIWLPRLAGYPFRDIAFWWGSIPSFYFCLCRKSNQPLEIHPGYLKVIYISENTYKMMEQEYM